MSDHVYTCLSRLIGHHGPALVQNPRLLEALLLDYCPGARHEVRILVLAAREGVPAEIQRTVALTERAVAKMARKLSQASGEDTAWADWAIRMWASVLDVGIQSMVVVLAVHRPTAFVERLSSEDIARAAIGVMCLLICVVIVVIIELAFSH